MSKTIFQTYRGYCKVFKVGDTATITKKITKEDIDSFIKLSGDSNPIHLEKQSKEMIVHGALLNSLVSGVIGTKLPGPGSIVVAQTLNFPNKCFRDETVTITVKLLQNRRIVSVDFICEVQDQQKIVLHGNAKLVMNKNV